MIDKKLTTVSIRCTHEEKAILVEWCEKLKVTQSELFRALFIIFTNAKGSPYRDFWVLADSQQHAIEAFIKNIKK